MAHIPSDAEWFLADIVMEIRVAGSRRNVVHINRVIIRASSAEDAFQRAMAFGKREAISYKNSSGDKVTIRCRGLGNLDVIYDPLGDGCEIMYVEKLGMSDKGIRKLVRKKRELEVFMPVRGRRGTPDYFPADVMKDLMKSASSPI